MYSSMVADEAQSLKRISGELAELTGHIHI
jgi:hypothetical protein